MAYNDLSESKITISTPYRPCRGADFYKYDTLSRNRNPENDTLFSGTSPYRKIHKCPPGSSAFDPFVFLSRSATGVMFMLRTMVMNIIHTK